MGNKIGTYAEAERLSGSGFNRVTIDGSMQNSNKCTAYCNFSDHPGFLTDKQIRQHDCMGKNCQHYLPRVSKVKSGRSISIKTNTEEIANELNSYLKKYEGIIIIKAQINFDKSCTAYYAAISKYDEKALERELKIKSGREVELVNLNYSFNNAAEIIFKRK